MANTTGKKVSSSGSSVESLNKPGLVVSTIRVAAIKIFPLRWMLGQQRTYNRFPFKDNQSERADAAGFLVHILLTSRQDAVSGTRPSSNQAAAHAQAGGEVR